MVRGEKAASTVPETEMIQNQGLKANLCVFNVYALRWNMGED